MPALLVFHAVITGTRRRIALLAALPEALPLLSAIPHFSLPDFSHSLCQSYCPLHWPDRRAHGDSASARFPDWAVHPRRGAAGASQKSGYADHGRVADRHRYFGAYVALGGPEQSVRLDRGVCHAGLRCDRFCRRLPESHSSPQSRSYRAGQTRLTGRGQHSDCDRTDRFAVPRIVLHQAGGAILQAVSPGPGDRKMGGSSPNVAAGFSAIRGLCCAGDCGIEQRGESYRRPGRAGHWLYGDRGRSARGSHLPQRPRDVCHLPRIAAHAADRRAHDLLRRHGRFRHWISLVQRTSGGSVHGRCRLAGVGRRDWHHRRYDQTGTPAAVYRRYFCHRGALGDLAGWFLQTAQEAHFQDGADPPSLRTVGVVGVEGDCALLDRIVGIRAVCADDIKTAIRESTTEARRHREKKQDLVCSVAPWLCGEIGLMELNNKRVLVVGLGKSGVASALFLKSRGARVTVS